MSGYFARKTIPLALVATLVSLMLLAGASCSSTPKPEAAFTAEATEGVIYNQSPISGLAPLTVRFQDRSAGQITEWRWNFGDGGTSNDRVPSHTYTKDGKYTVTLSVEGPGGSSTKPRPLYIQVLSISEAANVELGAVREAIAKCMGNAVVDNLDRSVTSWNGTAGMVTAGTEDAKNYLPAEPLTPLKATYDIDIHGTVIGGTDVSWGGIVWDSSAGVVRWVSVED